MAVTDAQMAAAIRAGVDFQELEPAVQGVITRLNRAARIVVQTHTDRAPEDVEDEAVIRVAGYLYDAPNVTRFGQAFRESGAMALVDPWKIRGASVVELDDGAAAVPENIDELRQAFADLEERVVELEPPPAYQGRVYSKRLGGIVDAAGIDGITFLGADSTHADGGADLAISAGPGPQSSILLAVPVAEGPLFTVIDLTLDPPEARDFYLPALGAPQFVQEIGPTAYFVYASAYEFGAYDTTYQLFAPRP